MDKPSPNKELFIEVTPSGTLSIYVESDGAKRWIEDEAPVYGELWTYCSKKDFYHLTVRPTYDRKQVMDYLNSYIQEQPK